MELLKMEQHHDTIKHTLDFAAVFAAISSFLQLLTPIFGLIGAVWTIMRIVEMVAGKPFAEVIRGNKDDAEQK
jgi:hypothetical protein